MDLLKYFILLYGFITITPLYNSANIKTKISCNSIKKNYFEQQVAFDYYEIDLYVNQKDFFDVYVQDILGKTVMTLRLGVIESGSQKIKIGINNDIKGIHDFIIFRNGKKYDRFFKFL